MFGVADTEGVGGRNKGQRVTSPPRLNLRLLLPGLILTAHMAFYGTWIVDDAAIVFAYARNLIEGAGIVAFPGDPSVEGFTSPLAFLVLAALMKLGLFHPVWAPKIIGWVFSIAALYVLRWTARRSFPAARHWTDIGIVLVAASPPVAIWSSSGLENPLYALVIALLLAWAVSAVLKHPDHASAIVAGLLAGVAVAVRPDGLTFAALWPLTVLIGSTGSLSLRIRGAAMAVSVTLGCVALQILWRWHQFGDVVPNTFRAKGASMESGLPKAVVLVLFVSTVLYIAYRWGRQRREVAVAAATLLLASAFWVQGLRGVPQALAGPLGPLVLATAFAATRLGGDWRMRLPWVLASSLGLFAFIALPGDWMGEFRFATPFLMIATVWATVEVGRGVTAISHARWRLAAGGLAVAAVILLLERDVSHAIRFREHPALPMRVVESQYRATFSQWAEDLELDDPVALVPDVGGALWARTVRVADLAGLCDRRIAGLVGDPSKMRRYILDELQPEFIRIHGPWAIVSGLPGDPQFESDYIEVLGTSGSAVSADVGASVFSGDYVRRDLVRDPELLVRWRTALE